MRIHTWAIGLFLIAGIGLFTAILFLIGNRHDVFGKHVEFYADFADTGGLPRGAQVRVAGVEAGELKGIEIPATPASKFRLKLQVSTNARGMIRTDSVVSIRTEGILGDKYIYIQEGTITAAEARDGATLPSKEPFDLGAVLEKGSALLDKSSALLDNVQGSVTDLHGRLDVALASVTQTVNHVDGLVTGVQPDIKRLASNAGQITDTINGIVSDLNAGKGPAGLLLKDEATREQLQATLSNARQATLNLTEASARADQLLADVQSRDLASKAQGILENVQAMSEQLNQTLKSALAADNMGQDGAANIRETLSKLNRGTANLAEDTEALKHEFFFRGFFKKRGFYNLEQLLRRPITSRRARARRRAGPGPGWMRPTCLPPAATAQCNWSKLGVTRSTARLRQWWTHSWIIWSSSKVTAVREPLTSNLSPREDALIWFASISRRIFTSNTAASGSCLFGTSRRTAPDERRGMVWPSCSSTTAENNRLAGGRIGGL